MRTTTTQIGRSTSYFSPRLGLAALLALPIAFVRCLPLGDAPMVQSVDGGSNHDDAGASHAGDAMPNGSGNPGTTPCAMGVLCIEQCASNDACAQDCFAKMTPAAQQALNALGECLDKAKCADSTCVQTNCANELAACTDDVAPPPGAGGGGNAPTPGGALDPSIVGTWGGVKGSVSFRSDGTFGRVLVWERSTTTCLTLDRVATVYAGNASTDGDTLTLSRESGTQTITECSGQVKSKAISPGVEQLTWSIDAEGKLWLSNSDGTRVYTRD